MQTYIAKTLLYSRDLVESRDPESGERRMIERGYIPVGATIDLDDDRAEVLLAIGAIAPAPKAQLPTKAQPPTRADKQTDER